MRLIGLLLVVGIIGFWWSRRGGSVTPGSQVDEELLGAAQPRPVLVTPGATPATPQPGSSTSGLRRSIDHTRGVLDKVKARNGDGEF